VSKFDHSQCKGITLTILLVSVLSWSGVTYSDTGLEQIEKSLEEGSSIRHVDVENILSSLNKHSDNTYLFDVRDPDEYAVSHLAGAIRLDPESDPGDFLETYGYLLEQGDVIFYCAVGTRSTELAQLIADLIDDQASHAEFSAAAPANMKGGIFHWHNDSLPLVDTEGSTDFVHPYSWFQKRLLLRKDKASYVPAH
jgi:rhodanese-related sulfurtransferase